MSTPTDWVALFFLNIHFTRKEKSEGVKKHTISYFASLILSSNNKSWRGEKKRVFQVKYIYSSSSKRRLFKGASTWRFSTSFRNLSSHVVSGGCVSQQPEELETTRTHIRPAQPPGERATENKAKTPPPPAAARKARLGDVSKIHPLLPFSLSLVFQQERNSKMGKRKRSSPSFVAAVNKKQREKKRAPSMSLRRTFGFLPLCAWGGERERRTTSRKSLHIPVTHTHKAARKILQNWKNEKHFKVFGFIENVYI